jgi:hypothetical protein
LVSALEESCGTALFNALMRAHSQISMKAMSLASLELPAVKRISPIAKWFAKAKALAGMQYFTFRRWNAAKAAA